MLLGIAGTDMSREHARETGRLLTEMDPDFVGALTVMVLPNTELGREYAEGEFQPLEVQLFGVG